MEEEQAEELATAAASIVRLASVTSPIVSVPLVATTEVTSAPAVLLLARSSRSTRVRRHLEEKNGLGANYHVQHMHTDYYVRTNDKLNCTMMGDTFMDGWKGIWSRTPPQPLTSLWGYVGQAAIFNLALRALNNRAGEPFVPQFDMTMFEDEKRPKKPGEGGSYKVNA